ncbi:MAG: DNA gyrase subunit A [Patescibacteria group bacterium]
MKPPKQQKPTIDRIEPREITTELQESYLDYAMSVIVARALPDVRDGLKPVHRRILWGMWDSGLTSSAKLRKSANIVGEVLGRYHPHGDMAVYDSIARMTQDFSLRYPLVIGQGNWGSIEGDSPAAPRYTECKMSKIAEELLVDIEKETVNWRPTYDNSRQEPITLPAKLPCLLLNGTVGIAVGMATYIPPHNLTEVVDAILHLIDRPKATGEDLLEYIKGPDFPTGGIIYDKRAIASAYMTGRGGITCRGLADVQEDKIVITQVPYQVNVSDLLVKIADLVIAKKIEGVRDVRNESDKDGLRIVIELKKDAVPQKVLNRLYKYTDLQKDFHFNMTALAGGLQPQVMSLLDILNAHIEHRKEVVRRRTEYELRKAKEREHILLGLAKALSVIDKVIATIKKSKDRGDAFNNLVKTFKFTDLQTNAILDMRLHTLAALERKKIEDELKEKQRIIQELTALLKDPNKILKVIKSELKELREKYGDARRTKVVAGGLQTFSEADLIKAEEVIVSLSHSGYIKRLSPNTFRSQHRGGKGLIGSELAEEDFLDHFFTANTHDNILFFTDKGRAFRTKVWEIPVSTRVAKGKSIQNFLEIPFNEKVSAIFAYPDDQNGYLVMATRNGVVKKTALNEFDNVRRNGIIAITLRKEDLLKWVQFSSGKDGVVLTTLKGQAIRFKESDIRPMGRTAAGVAGIRLRSEDEVSSLNVIPSEVEGSHKKTKLLAIMENGYGKQTKISLYKVQKRGGSGIKTAKITAKTGRLISSHLTNGEQDLFILSSKGQIIRTQLSSVRSAGRDTQGVKIMSLRANDKIIGTICL